MGRCCLFLLVVWYVQLNDAFISSSRSVKIREINVGIIDRGAKYKDVFEFSLDYVNNLSILPNTKLVPVYRSVNNKPLETTKIVFELLQTGVLCIISLAPSSITELVTNFANEKNVPVVAVTASDPLLENGVLRPYLLRISPSDKQQSSAISDILSHFRWLHFSIMTSYDSYGIHGVSGIQQSASSRNWKVLNIQHFNGFDDDGQLNVTKELSRIYKSESRIVVLNCGAKAAGQILAQAEEFGLASEGYAWIVTDGVTGNFNELKSPTHYFGQYLDGLIGTQPATNDGLLYKWFITEFSKKYNRRKTDITPFATLAFDSVYVVAQAIDNYLADGHIMRLQSLDAFNFKGDGGSFQNGSMFYNYLKNVTVNGASKKLTFGPTGEISNAKYDIVNFDNDYFQQVGYWTPIDKFVVTRPVMFAGRTFEPPEYQLKNLKGRHLRLGIDVDPPFVITKSAQCKGSHCYSGYCIDMVALLAKDLEFTYDFYLPADGTWGGYDAERDSWTGIFSDLLERRIDIATVHMSINSIREQSIDFSVPFMQAGLTVIIKGEEETSDGYFFLSPFSSDVLYAIGAGVLAVIIVVWVYSRVSPFGLYWRKKFALMSCKCTTCKVRRSLGRQYDTHDKCAVDNLEKEDDTLGTHRLPVDHLNMPNSSWIVVASLLNQDPVVSWPTSLPGRIVLLFWWLVVMVVLAMYTANLAAFLTITKMTTGLTKIEDLLTQSKYTWGTVKDTHPEVALNNSVRQDFREIIRRQNPVNNTDDGFHRVLTDNYAFIYESPIFNYMKRKHCQLEEIASGEFLSFDYAFGFPPDSPYIDIINRALLRLQENSRLDTLWEGILQNTGQCPPRPPSARLTLQSLNGVFTVLAMGLCLSVFALLGEYCFVVYRDVNGETVGLPHDERPKSISAALYRRLKYLIWDLTEPLRPKSDISEKLGEQLHCESHPMIQIGDQHPAEWVGKNGGLHEKSIGGSLHSRSHSHHSQLGSNINVEVGDTLLDHRTSSNNVSKA